MRVTEWWQSVFNRKLNCDPPETRAVYTGITLGLQEQQIRIRFYEPKDGKNVREK